ncbi:hypothetical protein BC831DRAFT_458074 [Entophlyctis helioformis]|nr:hypothetical protein BC831DRAFT_458074 [Entophlyctis helioformis]
MPKRHQRDRCRSGAGRHAHRQPQCRGVRAYWRQHCIAHQHGQCCHPRHPLYTLQHRLYIFICVRLRDGRL